MINIPIYRAKDAHSNKRVEGLLLKAIIGGNEAYFIENWKKTRIDTTTLAIHFPDMLDSQGNKIFASLSEDGKGGNILEYEDVTGTAYLDIYTYSVRANTNQGYLMPHMFRNSKVIGIQE